MTKTLSTIQVSHKVYDALGGERRKVAAKLEEITKVLANTPPKTRRRGSLLNQQGQLQARLLELNESLARLKQESEPDERRPGRPLEDVHDERWDSLVERVTSEAQSHRSTLNRYAGGAHAATLAAALAYANTHAMKVDPSAAPWLWWLFGLSIAGLALSPIHPVLRLAELRSAGGIAVSGRGEAHYSRVIAALAKHSRDYGRWQVALLVVQFGLWAVSVWCVGALLHAALQTAPTPAVDGL